MVCSYDAGREKNAESHKSLRITIMSFDQVSNSFDAVSNPFVPRAFEAGDNNNALNFASVMNDDSDSDSLSAVSAMCDPYMDLNVPDNHPLRSFLYSDNMLSPEAMQGLTRLADNRINIRAVVGEGDNRQKVDVDIARLPGGAFFVRDHVAGTSTMYVGDSKIKMLPNGQTIISSPGGMKTVKESFLMKSGDSMIKINPSTGGVHLFSRDGNVQTITSPDYWAPPRPRPGKAI
jgi:hypothetical protein